MNIQNLRVAVLGLGYVGLPLALALSRKVRVTGFDVSKARVEELKQNHDRNSETPVAVLRSTTMQFTSHADDLNDHDIFIVTVPTPITDDYQPDLSYVESASTLCGKYLKQGAIVVFESTVYPGVTEDVCGPILETVSGLKCGKDFYLGYSPERINPGDTEHVVEKVTKIVAGQTPEITEILAEVYGLVNGGNIYKATTIKTAEAAKVIENAQRDINIAFVNEITMILSKMGLSAYDVLAAAGTKWNFLKFTPGFVGGHCIGVDPYYLTHLAETLGHKSKVILSGRDTNEYMPQFIAEQIHQKLHQKSAKVLCLGVTFKENVSDIRNSKVVELINALTKLGHTVLTHDPHADLQETKDHLGIDLMASLNAESDFDAVIAAVPHQEYCTLGAGVIEAMLKPNALVCDIKNMWPHLTFTNANYWLL